MRSISILILCLSATLVLAQKQTPPAGGTPKDFKLPNKKTAQLDNGLRSVLVPYGVLPKVNIQLVIKTGNVHEGPDEVWLGDLTGDLMKEGTKTMDFKTISKKVAGMGGEVNINTGMDATTINGSVLAEFAPDLIRVLADIAINPALPASEIDRLKATLKRNLAVQTSRPQAQAMQKFFGTIYPDHPYGRYFPTEAMLDSYTIEKVKGFYEKNFGAKRSVLYVVGKFDEGRVNEAIRQSFGSWAAGPEPDYPVATPKMTNEVAIVDRPNAPQTTILIGLPVLTPKDPDFIAQQVTNSLLGGSFGSRITSNIRENKGYTYSPFSTVQNRHGVSVWYEQADVTSEHTGASLQEISYEIKRLQNEPPAKEELEGIQRYEAGIFVLQNSTPGGIINQLNFIDQNGLDDTYLTNRVKNIYAVTPEKVSQIVKDHLPYENMTLVMVGDKKSLDAQMKAHQATPKTR